MTRMLNWWREEKKREDADGENTFAPQEPRRKRASRKSKRDGHPQAVPLPHTFLFSDNIGKEEDFLARASFFGFASRKSPTANETRGISPRCFPCLA